MPTTQLAPSRPTRIETERQSDYRICTRCVMDTSDPDIQFDESGVCNHCRKYDERAARELFSGEDGHRRLEEIVDKIKQDGRGRPYDCVIGVSGGVDSTTVAYHAKRLGLRPLALHLDNGWDSELAVDNIKRTLQALDIDLHTHVIEWEEFRDLQLSFLKASVPSCEIPTDHAINALLIKTAARRGIRYLVIGGNLTTEGIMPISWTYYSQDLRHLRAIHRQFGTRKLRTTPRIGLPGIFYSFFLKRVRWVRLLDYLDYNRDESKELIQSELGWRDYGGKHYESVYTRFFQRYILPEKFGFDKRRPHLSAMIASGQITRDEALRELEEDLYTEEDLEHDREFVIKKFQLTPEEFDAILQQPPRSHYEFPSNRLIFHDLRGLKSLFKRIVTRV